MPFSPGAGLPSAQSCLGALLGQEPLAGADLRAEQAVRSPLNWHSLCQGDQVGTEEQPVTWGCSAYILGAVHSQVRGGALLSWRTREEQGEKSLGQRRE